VMSHPLLGETTFSDQALQHISYLESLCGAATGRSRGMSR
jgi:hypothetical protein